MSSKKKINKLNPKVLVAPLDWGLGHATRCIPLVTELLRNKCEVIIAANGSIYSLLKNEFPALEFLPVKGYQINYAAKKFLFPLKILLQVPKLILAIYREHIWLKKIIEQHKIKVVISDNKFGLYNKKITCVYITHQLIIKTKNIFSQNLLKRLHFYFINKYTQCWVPDFKNDGLAGALSHPDTLPKNVKYIGALTRFENTVVIKEKKYNLLIILSGPEPQRSILENILLKQVAFYKEETLLVRGLPGSQDNLHSDNRALSIINHLSAEKLNNVIQQSLMIICRSGYTTIMDLVKLRKKAILIPTPGQTEQEYLAKYLMEKNIFYAVEQKDFDLNYVLNQAFRFAFTMPQHDMSEYKFAVKQFVQSL